MAERKVRVPSIDCIHCVRAIEREVGGIEGVQTVTSDETTRTVTVVFEPPSLWPKIEAFLAAIGYPTEELGGDSVGQAG